MPTHGGIRAKRWIILERWTAAMMVSDVEGFRKSHSAYFGAAKDTRDGSFVADTENNLDIGIKQPGAFRHSSFLRGSRISAAGLITVKDGRLRIL